MPIFPLRDYQDYAVSCIMNHIKYKPDANGYIKASGGAGKSLMIAAVAEYCYSMGKKVVILTRNEKLLTQNRDKFSVLFRPHVGIYCSGLSQRDLGKQITIASIQSIYKLGETIAPRPDIVLIDEVQNLHPDDESDTQYWQFLRDVGLPQVIGFTATDWRTTSGKLSFGDMIANIPIKPLIDAGHIMSPINKLVAAPDVSLVQIIRGEYNEGQLEEIYLEPELLAKSISILQDYTADKHSVVIYTQSRKHGKVLLEAIKDNNLCGNGHEHGAVYVDGETPKNDLHVILNDFSLLKIKYLINVALLVEGWDCPQIDCVAVFLKTMSKGKFEQILYRGTRPCPELGKCNFLVLDMGGNFSSHGSLGSPYVGSQKKGEAAAQKGKICPECETWTELRGAQECPDCGYLFPEQEAHKVSHNHKPDANSSVVYTGNIETHQIISVSYHKHKSKKGNDTIRVDYFCSYGKYGSISQWLVLWRLEKFFKERDYPLGSPIEMYSWDDLVWHCEQTKKPIEITVDHSQKFPEIIAVSFGEQMGIFAPALPPPLPIELDDEIIW